MANNRDYTNSENILVKVDQNNLVYVDPNSVVDSNGEIQPRGHKQENLVMYVNLEADLVPRTVLISDNDKGNTLTQIAGGNLNFLKNATGDGNFDATWTDAFVPKPIQGQESNYKNGYDVTFGENQFKDTSGQSFGIDSISISIKGANFVPTVNISFIDVRGKTLFESSENSPYRAFFHLPWPIFYLTVKGYYGKAIRYRLHMTKFSSRFNESNGNFEISTIFVGSTYAWMNDITLSQIITCPYMFLVEENKNTSFNEKTGLYEKTVSHSSRGYQILKSVYRQYEQKGLIPKGFPVRTLTEMGYIAESLDKILEQQIFSGVDMGVFQGVKELDETINNYENSFKAWAKKNLSNESEKISEDEFWYYTSLKDKTKLDTVVGDKNGTLELLIKNFNETIEKNRLFTQTLSNNTTGDFKKISIKKLKSASTYYKILTDKKVVINIDGIFNDIFQIRKSFEEQRKKLEDDVEFRMNEIIKGKEGFGFEPTIRNMFAVLLANAEVYIRLMKDVHNKAFTASLSRKNSVKNLSKESKGESIYPWPEVSKPQQGGKINVIAYPGDEQLIHKLESYDSTKWPEVDFVEEYIKINTNRVETNVQNEPTRNDVNYVFDSNADLNSVSPISTTDFIISRVPYIDKDYASFLYEIYERARFLTMFDSFTNEMLTELANEEFNNIKKSIEEDGDLIEIAKRIRSVDDFIRVEYQQTKKDENGKIELDENNNPKTQTEYSGYLFISSPYDKFSKYKDTLPTTNYLVETLEEPFKFESYNLNVTIKDGGLDSDKINNYLLNYRPESYRKNIYPFNSNTYLGYINKTTFSDDNFKFNGILKHESSNGFISSPINPNSWVKSGGNNLTNFFSNTVSVTGNTVSILNTPYFHNQLYYDFNKSTVNGKYAGSAYLLLNSLPFIDLDDQITFGNTSILTSSLFREIGSTHFIPYHLLLKWGSIYHRYKTHLIDGYDILEGAINSSYVTKPLSGQTFFDNNSGYTFTITPKISTTTGSTLNVSYTGYTSVGLSPFYQSIYSQIVNDYTHYNNSLGNSSYSANTLNNSIIHRVRTKTQMNYWDVIVDNTKYKTDEKTYTLLPSIGDYSSAKIFVYTDNSFDFVQQIGFRTLWFLDDTITNSFTGQTFPTPYEYFRTTGNTYSISTNYKKAIDLIGTFSPTILEYFESYFLDFASQKMNDELPYKPFNNLNFQKFQDVLTRLSVIDKTNLPQDPISLSDIDLLIDNLKRKQKEAAESITNSILGSNNLIQFSLSNPKEIDPFILYGMTKSNPDTTYLTQPFSSSDINSTNQNFIKLYIGEDIDGYYLEFFSVNNIKLTEDNIKTHRPFAQIYGGYRKNGGVASRSSFLNYLKNEVIIKNTSGNIIAKGSDIRFKYFLTQLLVNFPNLDSKKSKNPASRIDMFRGYNSDNTKLELYNTFKSFNDKWTSGNSIGQRLLLEEFLFLDKANRDIGDKLYLNIDRFKDLLQPKNLKQSLYGAISMLIQGTGLDMRALPAYINFYGNNVNIKNKIRPSKKVASDLFGTFLEVDYQESTPKIIIQLVGNNSKRLDMSNSKPYKFTDDGFYVGSQNNNPLLITSLENFSRNDLSKSNRVVAFEVSFGDQNQGIFKGLTLDQSTLKNTSESFLVLENLARSASGAGVHNVDVSLFDYYKQASYKCDVTSMGNVMIQPTMFFYLKNVPMFRGSYWITEVTHTIKSNNISTTFSGTRLPYSSLPDPKDSFIASYRILFDKIQSKATRIVKQRESNKTDTQETVLYQKINYITDRGGKIIQGEQILNKLEDVGINKFGVPFNGFNEQRTIQKVKNNNQIWLRGLVVQMGGTGNTINDTTSMNIANGIKFSDIQNTNYKYFMVNFQLSRQITADLIRTAKTTFKNPKNNKTVVVNPNYQLDSSLGTIVAEGPVAIGPISSTYGIALSKKLMSELKLFDGDVVYFNME